MFGVHSALYLHPSGPAEDGGILRHIDGGQVIPTTKLAAWEIRFQLTSVGMEVRGSPPPLRSGGQGLSSGARKDQFTIVNSQLTTLLIVNGQS